MKTQETENPYLQTIGTLASEKIDQIKASKSETLSNDSSDSEAKRQRWIQKWVKLNCHHPKLVELANSVYAFCGRWIRNEPRPGMLVLAGDVRCGKTHTAKAIWHFCQNSAWNAFTVAKRPNVPAVTFVRWSEVADGFKDGRYGIVEDLSRDSLVIIDDLGAEHDPSRNAVNKLCQILSRRENLFTVVTTNIAPENWPSTFDARVADRLLRNSEVYELFDVPNYGAI
jgi:DNA replication protein DnaC